MFYVEALDVISEYFARIGERSCAKRDRLIREIVEAYIGATFERHTGLKLGEYIVGRTQGKVYQWQGRGPATRFTVHSNENPTQSGKQKRAAVTCSLQPSSPVIGVTWSSPAEQQSVAFARNEWPVGGQQFDEWHVR